MSCLTCASTCSDAACAAAASPDECSLSLRPRPPLSLVSPCLAHDGAGQHALRFPTFSNQYRTGSAVLSPTLAGLRPPLPPTRGRPLSSPGPRLQLGALLLLSCPSVPSTVACGLRSALWQERRRGVCKEEPHARCRRLVSLLLLSRARPVEGRAREDHGAQVERMLGAVRGWRHDGERLSLSESAARGRKGAARPERAVTGRAAL